jgi:hypothetical protein
VTRHARGGGRFGRAGRDLWHRTPRGRGTNSGERSRRRSRMPNVGTGPQVCSFSHSVPRLLRASSVVWRSLRPQLATTSGRSLPMQGARARTAPSQQCVRPCERPHSSRRSATVVCAARCRRDLDGIASRPCASGCLLPVDPTGRSVPLWQDVMAAGVAVFAFYSSDIFANYITQSRFFGNCAGVSWFLNW